MQRLDAKGRGILLLHDIHPATALALPSLLKELKEHGYKVVHVVPAGELPKSVPELPAPAAIASGDMAARIACQCNNRRDRDSDFASSG